MAPRRVRWRSGRVRAPPVSSVRLLLEPGQDLPGGQDLGPGGGQLDGQRQPVQPGADLRHRLGVLLGQLEAGPHRLGPLDEQPDRVGPAKGLGVGGPCRVGQGQRRHHQLLLPPERERDPAGGQHREPRRGGEQLLDHRAGLPHLLEVVGHEQELPVAEVVAQRLQDGAAGCLGDPQGPGQDGGDQVRVGDRGQVGEEGAVAVAGQQLGRDLEGQAGLAGAAGAGEGEQPGPSQQPPGLGGLPLPADERGELGGQVARPGVQGPGREEVGRESLDHQVVQAHREVEVLEPVLAEVAYGGPLGDGVLDQAAGGAGDDHLAAVGRPGDPGRAVDVDADVVVPAQHPLAGVQAHAHPHREPLRPGVGGQAPLGRHRGPDRRHRAREGGEERVALGADLDPVPIPDGPAQDGRVLVPDRRVASAQLLEQPGRALDVGEQEGDGPGRQLRDLGPGRRRRWPVGGGAGRGHRPRGRRLPGRLPAPPQLQAGPEQHRRHPQQRHHAPQDAGGRVERLAGPDPLGGGHGHGDHPAEQGGGDHAGVAGEVGGRPVAVGRRRLVPARASWAATVRGFPPGGDAAVAGQP